MQKFEQCLKNGKKDIIQLIFNPWPLHLLNNLENIPLVQVYCLLQKG